MPKELKSYQCKYCGAIYANEELASNCEVTHVHAEFIDKEVFNTHSTISYPLDIRMSDGSVNIRMSDGSVIRYRLG